ncbi:Nn.00g014350.m01.CDS01 [Neocucurbitaria sp. VM-36]
MFPKRHAFGYSYLQCGYPIIPVATTAGGTDISDGRDREMGSWWLRVRADDYLERGNGALGFYGKLQMYLRDQHVKDSDWSYAYFITAPRFFGYAFNPVSFWYIYDREHQLKKMILEVNNTFGERRMYLLDGSSPLSPPQRSSASEETGLELPDELHPRFTDIWMKDFHVSPFNSRKGSYALKALNPFPNVSYDAPTIDNTITLKSSKDHAKLVARLHSTGEAFDPNELGFFGTFRFVLSWWWVGFVTFPRILREATKLFFKRKLNVWFRPEVLTSSVGRLPTASEIILHETFKDYLFQLVHEKEDPFCITLKTAIPNVPTEKIMTTHQPGHDRGMNNLEIRVLTPAFYSRLVHYSYTSEAFDRECIFTDERNRTLWVCRPQLLALLLEKKSSLQTRGEELPVVDRSYLDELRWTILRKLRCPPADPAYSLTPKSSAFYIDDIRSRPYSELDNFVRKFRGRSDGAEYRRAVTKLFLAQRFCFGFPEVVTIVDFSLRVLLSYIAVLQLISIGETEVLELMEKSSTRECWSSFFRSVILMLGCHAYELLKGYR